MPDKGTRPSRKSDGRPGPPPRYPKYQEKYADPENWKYPIHTPAHARAAKRYFNKESNRAKYTKEERILIDNRIEAALRRFGVSLKIKGGKVEAERGIIQADIPLDKDIDSMTVDELLSLFLGEARTNRAESIPQSQLSFSEEGDVIKARIKQYSVLVDVAERKIVHDCMDWKRRSEIGLFCKHLGKVFLSLPEERSRELLKEVIRKRESWRFEWS